MATLEKVDDNTVKIKQVVDGVPTEVDYKHEELTSIAELFTARHAALIAEPDYAGKDAAVANADIFAKKWTKVIDDAEKLGVKAKNK